MYQRWTGLGRYRRFQRGRFDTSNEEVTRNVGQAILLQPPFWRRFVVADSLNFHRAPAESRRQPGLAAPHVDGNLVTVPEFH
jgi:hypothetical protein